MTPERGVRVVDGLITGWHEPRSRTSGCWRRSPATPFERPTRQLAPGYRWHEFGDIHLMLP